MKRERALIDRLKMSVSALFLISITASIVAVVCHSFTNTAIKVHSDETIDPYPIGPTDDGAYLLGSYPQTVVSGTNCLNIIAELDLITTTNPRGYLEYNGKEYQRVSATPAEGGYISRDGSTTFSSGSIYYFLVEPIRWRILSSSSENMFLLTEDVLDVKQFDSGTSRWGRNTLRAFLNDAFYNKAFTSIDQGFIKTSNLINGSKNYPENEDNTNDKVFTPHYWDFVNTGHGFTNSEADHNSRVAVASDYAKATGLRVYNNTTANYWTRSFYSIGIMSGIWYIGNAGGVKSGLNNHKNSDYGVRPAINISR
ncbi:MAG: DUF6273 domain-containing protein [Erysipelotrichaceae bacterium]|jgi:hypothetical protein|nr:DUF6273 domain-containing protein [Erysipelotrichaceae bacterium]